MDRPAEPTMPVDNPGPANGHPDTGPNLTSSPPTVEHIKSKPLREDTEMPELTTGTPAGYTTVAPWVVTDDTGAFLDFVAKAFEGGELARVVVEDGAVGHGEIRVGDTVVLAFDRQPDWPAMPSLLRVFVPDADAALARATAAGATIVTPISDSAFGQRGGRVRDPFGNIWWVSCHVEDVPEDVMWQRMQEPAYVEAMRVAQETLDTELSGRQEGWSSAPVRPPVG
jgi:uncharacterized glyoxalase superfamily protein PhnB